MYVLVFALKALILQPAKKNIRILVRNFFFFYELSQTRHCDNKTIPNLFF